jgi:hypothetical protein
MSFLAHDDTPGIRDCKPERKVPRSSLRVVITEVRNFPADSIAIEYICVNRDVWPVSSFQERTQRERAAGQVAMGMGLAEQICKPRADIPALGYRATMLWLLSQIARERFAAFTKDGQPIDAAFRAAAKAPVEWMGEGITHQAPFDVDEFLRLCSET